MQKGYDFERTAPSRFYGQLLREKHIGGTPVVTLSISGNTRTETRGDGPSRTFIYGATTQAGYSIPRPYLLAETTDFRGNRSYSSYDANGFVDKVKDFRGVQTSFTRLAATGRVSTVTLPPDKTNPSVTVTYSYTDPNTGYYLGSVRNERGFTTTYTRDAAKRVERIDYPDTGYETFTYNLFNQVLTHRTTAGGTWVNGYDPRGNMMTIKTPYDETTTYGYDVNDRTSTVQDARNHITNLTYDARGRLTSRRHPAPELGKRKGSGEYSCGNDGPGGVIAQGGDHA